MYGRGEELRRINIRLLTYQNQVKNTQGSSCFFFLLFQVFRQRTDRKEGTTADTPYSECSPGVEPQPTDDVRPGEHEQQGCIRGCCLQHPSSVPTGATREHYGQQTIHPSTHLFLRPLQTFVRPPTHSPTPVFLRSFVPLPIHSPIPWFIRPFHSFILQSLPGDRHLYPNNAP